MKHLALILLTACLAAPAWSDNYREVTWDDLMPEGWMPPEMSEEHDPFSNPQPSEPAPVVPALNAKKIRIPGYVIPLKFDQDAVTEFLLVPFVGACIHVPPPPENQMVYVKLKQPLVSEELWAPVWVSGTMRTEASLTQYATAGYRINDAITEPYEY